MQDSTKTILCYGDSNTWGNIPRSDRRYPKSVRWPGALQNLLGETYDVVSEGLCGRTLVAEEPSKPHRTGITHLQAITESHDPLDMVVIMLGTNDVKTTYDLKPELIAEHLEQTIQLIKNNESLEKIPAIIVVCPPPVIIPSDGKLDARMADAPEKFNTLPELYRIVADKNGCAFINAGEYISSSTVDGYHLEKDAHLKLAEIIGEQIKKMEI